MNTILFIILAILPTNPVFIIDFLIPIRSLHRESFKEMKLTSIGDFGLLRKSRPDIPSHLHTGIDIQRPTNNYLDEPIFAITKGVVISLRNDGPYAQIIIEHRKQSMIFWSVYEHISGIKINVSDSVNSNTSIARFMNKDELNKYGWQFDHLHFEILKVKPIKIKKDASNPYRFFKSYTLQCYSNKDLEHYYFNPMQLF